MEHNQAISAEQTEQYLEHRKYLKRIEIAQKRKHSEQKRKLVMANCKLERLALKVSYFFINFFDIKELNK